MQKNYRQYFTQAIAGMVEGMGVGSVEAYHNDSGYVKEVWTVTTPATPATATLYSITLYDADTSDNPIVVSFTTASTVRADLATGLYNAFRANLRASQIATVVNNTSTLVFTHRKDNTPFFVTIGGGGAAPLTVPTTATTAAAAPSRIPFGVFLTKVASTPRVLGSLTGGSIRLPNSGDALAAICGFARLNTSVQKDVVGPAATAGYEANQLAVDVQRRLGDLSGIWVPTLETSIASESDSVYISVAAGSKGFAQKSNANSAIDASARARFASDVVTDINNNRVVLVYANF